MSLGTYVDLTEDRGIWGLRAGDSYDESAYSALNVWDESEGVVVKAPLQVMRKYMRRKNPTALVLACAEIDTQAKEIIQVAIDEGTPINTPWGDVIVGNLHKEFLALLALEEKEILERAKGEAETKRPEPAPGASNNGQKRNTSGARRHI